MGSTDAGCELANRQIEGVSIVIFGEMYSRAVNGHESQVADRTFKRGSNKRQRRTLIVCRPVRTSPTGENRFNF
jgi:hypothetical protein